MNSLERRIGDEMNNFDKILSAGSCPPELLREMNLRFGPLASEFRKFHEDVGKIEVPNCLLSIEIDKLIGTSQINPYILEQLENVGTNIQVLPDVIDGFNSLSNKLELNMAGSCSEIQERISDYVLGHEPDVNQASLGDFSAFLSNLGKDVERAFNGIIFNTSIVESRLSEIGESLTSLGRRQFDFMEKANVDRLQVLLRGIGDNQSIFRQEDIGRYLGNIFAGETPEILKPQSYFSGKTRGLTNLGISLDTNVLYEKLLARDCCTDSYNMAELCNDSQLCYVENIALRSESNRANFNYCEQSVSSTKVELIKSVPLTSLELPKKYIWKIVGGVILITGYFPSNTVLGHFAYSAYDYFMKEIYGVHVDYSKPLLMLFEEKMEKNINREFDIIKPEEDSFEHNAQKRC